MKNYRTKYLEPDYRRKPKTNQFCIRCQRDIKPGSKWKWVHLVDGGLEILHPEDESKYVPDAGNLDLFKMGPECAKIIGLEWCLDQK